MNPNWCEGHVTLARGQRELGEVELAIQSYEKAISLFSTSSLSDEDKKDIEKEFKELKQLLSVEVIGVIVTFRNISRNMVNCKDEHMLLNI